MFVRAPNARWNTADTSDPSSILSTSFSGAAKTYSRVVPVVMFMLKGILAGNTPRKAFMKEVNLDLLSNYFPAMEIIGNQWLTI